MSKTLSTILTIFKVAKIVAKVIFILCIIGGAGCLLSLVMLPFAGGILQMLGEGEEILPSTYFEAVVGAIACAGDAVVAYFAEKYFGHVLESGTPFTLEGSKECFNFGLVSIITSLAVSVASGIAIGICLLFSAEAQGFDAETSVSLTTGLLFLFISLIFKYGAEQAVSAHETASEENTQEETQTETEQI